MGNRRTDSMQIKAAIFANGSLALFSDGHPYLTLTYICKRQNAKYLFFCDKMEIKTGAKGICPRKREHCGV